MPSRQPTRKQQVAPGIFFYPNAKVGGVRWRRADGTALSVKAVEEAGLDFHAGPPAREKPDENTAPTAQDSTPATPGPLGQDPNWIPHGTRQAMVKVVQEAAAAESSSDEPSVDAVPPSSHDSDEAYVSDSETEGAPMDPFVEVKIVEQKGTDDVEPYERESSEEPRPSLAKATTTTTPGNDAQPPRVYTMGRDAAHPAPPEGPPRLERAVSTKPDALAGPQGISTSFPPASAQLKAARTSPPRSEPTISGVIRAVRSWASGNTSQAPEPANVSGHREPHPEGAAQAAPSTPAFRLRSRAPLEAASEARTRRVPSRVSSGASHHTTETLSTRTLSTRTEHVPPAGPQPLRPQSVRRHATSQTQPTGSRTATRSYSPSPRPMDGAAHPDPPGARQMRQNSMNTLFALNQEHLGDQAAVVTEKVMAALQAFPQGDSVTSAQLELLTGLVTDLSREVKALKADPDRTPSTRWHRAVSLLTHPSARKAAALIVYAVASYISLRLSFLRVLLQLLQGATAPEVKKIRLQCDCPCPGGSSVFQDVSMTAKSAINEGVTKAVTLEATNWAAAQTTVATAIVVSTPVADGLLVAAVVYTVECGVQTLFGFSMLEYFVLAVIKTATAYLIL